LAAFVIVRDSITNKPTNYKFPLFVHLVKPEETRWRN